MYMVLVIYLALYVGVAWLLLSLVLERKKHPKWFGGIVVTWALLPQFYWGAMTFKDYLVFREQCQQLDPLSLQAPVPTGSVAVFPGAIYHTELADLDAVFADVYYKGASPILQASVSKVAVAECPRRVARIDGYYQEWFSDVGCVRHIPLGRSVETDYVLRTVSDRPLLADELTSFTGMGSYVHHLTETDGGGQISELKQLWLSKHIPWNFFLGPFLQVIGTCSTDGLSVESWLASTIEDDSHELD